MGDASAPPYCARHTKVCVLPAKAVSYFAGWEPNVVRNPQGIGGFQERSAVDVILKLQERGVFLND